MVSDDALAGGAVATGASVTATGPLGQRDSSGTGLGGYRLHATLPGEFTVEGGQLTPTLKVKRRVVYQKYAAEIERHYAPLAERRDDPQRGDVVT